MFVFFTSLLVCAFLFSPLPLYASPLLCRLFTSLISIFLLFSLLSFIFLRFSFYNHISSPPLIFLHISFPSFMILRISSLSLVSSHIYSLLFLSLDIHPCFFLFILHTRLLVSSPHFASFPVTILFLSYLVISIFSSPVNSSQTCLISRSLLAEEMCFC